jgi:hypothetical protein
MDFRMNKKRIIVRLAGGLGNQIFQIGASLLLSKKSNIKTIILDDSKLKNYGTKRTNDLLSFFDFDKIECEILWQSSKITNLRVSKFLPLKIPYYPFISDANFQKSLSKPNPIFMFLDGYFQNCLTQPDFDCEIKILKDILKQNNIQEKNGCILHIRGGDFVKLGWNSVASKEYYFKAIKLIENKYRERNFYVVTDDKKYAMDILNELNINYKFIGGNIIEDFYLLGKFKYRILSSSTFAIWASALGENNESIVIAPKYWIPNKAREITIPNEIDNK